MANGLGFGTFQQTALTVAVLLATLVFVAGFVSAVVGVGKLDKDCDYNGCKEAFRPQWWALSFELATYIFMFGSLLTGVFDQVRVAVIAFLALTAVNTEDLTEVYIQLNDDLDDLDEDENEDSIRAALAGFLILTFCNFVFILIWGISSYSAQAMQAMGNFTPVAPKQTPVGKSDAPYTGETDLKA